jgi:hypothetical protein
VLWKDCRELADHAAVASGVGARMTGGSRYTIYVMIVKCELYAIGLILENRGDKDEDTRNVLVMRGISHKWPFPFLEPKPCQDTLTPDPFHR